MSIIRFIALIAPLVAPALSQAAPQGYGATPQMWTYNPSGPDQTGACAGNVSNVEFLGNVTTPNSRSSRDCGFHGSVGKFQINSYGDTSQCKEGAQLDNCWEGQNFVGSNTAGLDTDNPLIVQDFNLTGGDRAQQFCPKMNIPEEQNNVLYAIGISNVVETGDNVGIVFTAMNDRTVDASGNAVQNVKCAGIGNIDASGDFPVCTRTVQCMWDAKQEPLWGDHGAVDGMDGYIYVYGAMMGGDVNDQMNVYIARVLKTQATNVDAYQYWNGKAYTSDRLINPTADQAAMQGVPPGQVYWNAYLFRWVSLTRDPTDMWGLDIQTAEHLHGPFSSMQKVYQESDLTPQPISIYAPAAHPQYDPSGQTLVVTYAAWGPIAAIKLHFSK